MKFIVLLFAVLLQKQTKQTGYQRNSGWFKRLLTPFAVSDMSITAQVFVFTLAVVLPCLILGALLSQLTGIVAGSLSVFLQVVLFLYILGRDDFSTRFASYKECWQRADYQGAYLCAQQFLNVQEQAQDKPVQLHKTVLQAIVFAWFSRFFIFVFWFLVAGIAGALACLLSYWFYREFKLPWLKSILGALEWLPSRLLALSIALAGDFVKTFPSAMKFISDFNSSTKEVLAATMSLNDGIDDTEFDCQQAKLALDDINQLMMRCAILWLLVVACLTVFAGF
jgi:AmpE protein